MTNASLPVSAAEAPTLRHPGLVLASVCALALMSTAGVAMPYPILAPIFIDGPVDGFTHFAGLDPRLLMGLALALNPLGILIGNLFTGPLSDHYGRRAVITVTLIATLLGYLLSAWALMQRWYLLFAFCRFATGLTEGNVAVARALVADMHGQIDLTRGLALLNAFLYAGWLVGPLVGGLSLGWGEPVPFVIAGLAMLPCLLVLMLGVPASPRTSAPMALLAAMRQQQVIGLLRQDRVLSRLALLQLCNALGVTALYEYAPLWMVDQAGLGSRGIAWVTAGQCALMTGVSMLAGQFGGRWQQRPLQGVAGMMALTAVGLLGLGLAPDRVGLALIMLLAIPIALCNALLPAWMSRRFEAHGQGRVMGLLSTIFCLGNVLIAVSGSLLALLSSRWIMVLGACTCTLAAVLMLRLAREEARSCA